MISVLNHLPLLNGNKLLIVSLLIFSFSSCSSKKITSSYTSKETIEIGGNKKDRKNNKEIVPIDIANNSEKLASDEEDSLEVTPQVIDIETITPKIDNSNSIKVPTQKLHYNIAVLLPFNLDQIPLGKYVDDSTKLLSKESHDAVEFYLGCMMAKDQFASANLKANVYFLDDKNDSLTTANLFNHNPFPTVDYIIGPITYKNIALAANKAASLKITLISPFASSIFIRNNPYFYNANASILTQYSFLLEYIHLNYPEKRIQVLYNNNDNTNLNINYLKDLAKKFQSDIVYTTIDEKSDIKKQINLVDSTNSQIVLLYSSNENLLKNILLKTKSSNNNLTVFTSHFKELSKIMLESKTKHTIFSASPYNFSQFNYKLFNHNFEEKYAKTPTDVAHQAYDILMHLLKALDQNISLDNSSQNAILDIENTQSKFNFMPITNSNGTIDYYNNTHLNLYKFENGQFELVRE